MFGETGRFLPPHEHAMPDVLCRFVAMLKSMLLRDATFGRYFSRSRKPLGASADAARDARSFVPPPGVGFAAAGWKRRAVARSRVIVLPMHPAARNRPRATRLRANERKRSDCDPMNAASVRRHWERAPSVWERAPRCCRRPPSDPETTDRLSARAPRTRRCLQSVRVTRAAFLGESSAVLVQSAGTGPILAAAKG